MKRPDSSVLELDEGAPLVEALGGVERRVDQIEVDLVQAEAHEAFIEAGDGQ